MGLRVLTTLTTFINYCFNANSVVLKIVMSSNGHKNYVTTIKSLKIYSKTHKTGKREINDVLMKFKALISQSPVKGLYKQIFGVLNVVLGFL